MRPYLLRLPEWLGTIPDWVPGIGGVPLGGRPVFSYGVMLGISFVLGALLGLRMCERLGVDRRRIPLLMVWAAVGALVGARITYFIASSKAPFTIGRFLAIQEGGLVAYGGFIGGLGLSLLVAAWRTGLGLWLGGADAVAPVMQLGTGITRLGCFLFGCDYGAPSEGAWALHFPRWDNPAIAPWIKGTAPAFADHLKRGLVAPDAAVSAGVHPTQLLMSLGGFLGFGVLMAMAPRLRFRGQLLMTFLIWEGVVRFLIEILRGDEIRGVGVLGTPFSTSQVISLVLVPLGVVGWILLRRRPA